MYQGNTSLFLQAQNHRKAREFSSCSHSQGIFFGGVLGEGGADLDFLGSGEKVTKKWDERKTKEDYVESVHV